MDPLTWTRTEAGRYVADNKLRTRRYVIQKLNKTWHLTVWRLKELTFTHGDNLYLTDGEDPAWRGGLPYDTKYEAVANANMWEAEKQGDREAKTRFHNQMVDRWIGTGLPEALAAELRDRLYT